MLDKNIYREMTLVTQKPYLFRRTVRDNIAYPLKIRNYKKENMSEEIKKI